MTEIVLPAAGGETLKVRMNPARSFTKHPERFSSRTVLAAPHVVADVTQEYTPGHTPPVDWDATMDFRRHLFSYGIGVAEGMDTSERGEGGLTWDQAKTLIKLGVEVAREADGDIVCGVGTDHIGLGKTTISEVKNAYLEQLGYVEDLGAAAVIRASHALVASAEGSDDYLSVYGEVLSRVSQPAIVHWLGTGFDPSLKGYWGSDDIPTAMETVLGMAEEYQDKIRGIKFSLLDADLEMEFRAKLPAGVKVFTGDDYGYTDLVLGDGTHHSHGLLGVLDPIAPIASAGFAALDRGDNETFAAEMNSTVPLAVKMFEAPADRYKVGVVFLAWLSGFQSHYRMVTGREGMRSLLHLSDLFRMTNDLGMFPDPDLARTRMQAFLASNGVDQ